MFEDELIPLFENCGTIWDLRLMMDPMTGTNRGYAFVTFTSRDAAVNAVRQVFHLNQHLGKIVVFSLKNKTKKVYLNQNQIFQEFKSKVPKTLPQKKNNKKNISNEAANKYSDLKNFFFLPQNIKKKIIIYLYAIFNKRTIDMCLF